MTKYLAAATGWESGRCFSWLTYVSCECSVETQSVFAFPSDGNAAKDMAGAFATHTLRLPKVSNSGQVARNMKMLSSAPGMKYYDGYFSTSVR